MTKSLIDKQICSVVDSVTTVMPDNEFTFASFTRAPFAIAAHAYTHIFVQNLKVKIFVHVSKESLATLGASPILLAQCVIRIRMAFQNRKIQGW